MALQPQSLPALQELEVGYIFPEWDLLFIILEKRIMEESRGRHNILALEKLVFHKRLSPSLRRALTARIKGFITPRPLNTHISPAANLRLRLDEDMYAASLRLLSFIDLFLAEDVKTAFNISHCVTFQFGLGL